MKTKNLIYFCIFITLCFTSYKLLYHEQKNNSQTLIAGIAAGYAPFISINEQGEYEGFDIDIVKQLAKSLNKKLILKDLGRMTSLFMALEQKSVDIIIWGISITKERLDKFAMVHYQGTNISSYPLIFWKEIPKGIININDMINMIVCVEPTSAQDTALQKYTHIQKLPTEKVDDALLNIQYGKAIAACVEPAIAKKFKAKFPEIQSLDIPLDEQNQEQGCGIVIRKNNADLINQIKVAIATMKNNDFIATMEKKWGLATDE